MPISMTPDQYYYAFVLGNYEEFMHNQGCVRCAFNVAVAASHLADHCFKYYRRHDSSKVSKHKTIGDYVNYISLNTNGFFQDIRSISNAYKHLYTSADLKKAPHSTISSTGAIESIELVNDNVNKLYEDFSAQNITEVIYTKKSGQQIKFLLAIEAVVDFWKKELI